MAPADPTVIVVTTALPPAPRVVMVPFMLSVVTVTKPEIVRVPTVLPDDTVSAVTLPLTVAPVAPSISIVVAPLTEAKVFPVAETFTAEAAVRLNVVAFIPVISTMPAVTVHAVSVAEPVRVVLYVA